MTAYRRERVESLLMAEISAILLRKINDPRIRGVHIVSVKMSPDLSSARVYYSTLEATTDPDEVQRGLDSAKRFIRSEVKKVIKMRFIPEVYFVFDPSIREGDRILTLLKKINPSDAPASDEPPRDTPDSDEPASDKE